MRHIRNLLSSALLLALIFFGLTIVGTKEAKAQNDWTEPFPAFRIAGNLYYVGSKGLANYLITTPQGRRPVDFDKEMDDFGQKEKERVYPHGATMSFQAWRVCFPLAGRAWGEANATSRRTP